MLSRHVFQRLNADGSRCFGQVAVGAQNGVALLSGVVESYTHREIAGQVARETQGIRDVCNMLSVASPDDRPADAGTQEEPLGPTCEQRSIGAGETAGDASASGHPSRQSARRQTAAGARLVVGIAICWWLLCLLLVTMGTIGIVIWCLAMAITLSARASRGSRGR
ncbi:BON domain-containing protein [Actinoplanes solisilvae]|uniref:BON domain-containing protein n=1 Tax=Actinoplanes solisilvae TaxID=2486853 RepID=UPI001F0B7DB8|nr:BON domain-containing protein [Actinoplanes solisilvae]